MAQRVTDKSEKERKYEKAQFHEGEKILCYHGPLIYEGKCIHLKEVEAKFEYFIHYNGWSKNWDEWVPENRLLKLNDENLKMKDELMKNRKNSKKTYKRRTSIGSAGDKEENNSRSNSPKPNLARKSVTIPVSRNSFTRIERHDRQQDLLSLRKRKEPATTIEYVENIRVNVQLPENLRLLLCYDLDLITRRKKVTKVPARITVDEITDKYVTHKTSLTEPALASRYKETANALRNYFDLVLDKKLLYSFEKVQHLKLVENKTAFVASSAYGAVHLVRLFVKVGHLIAHLPVDEIGASSVEENINDYLRYLNLNIGKFVNIEDYQPTSSDYQKKVKEMAKTASTPIRVQTPSTNSKWVLYGGDRGIFNFEFDSRCRRSVMTVAPLASRDSFPFEGAKELSAHQPLVHDHYSVCVATRFSQEKKSNVIAEASDCRPKSGLLTPSDERCDNKRTSRYGNSHDFETVPTPRRRLRASTSKIGGRETPALANSRVRVARYDIQLRPASDRKSYALTDTDRSTAPSLAPLYDAVARSDRGKRGRARGRGVDVRDEIVAAGTANGDGNQRRQSIGCLAQTSFPTLKGRERASLSRPLRHHLDPNFVHSARRFDAVFIERRVASSFLQPLAPLAGSFRPGVHVASAYTRFVAYADADSSVGRTIVAIQAGAGAGAGFPRGEFTEAFAFPFGYSQSFSSLAILEAIFLKPIDVPDILLKRTPLSESRGNLHTSISHWTSESVFGSPCTHSSRNRSRCS
ncbi:hypothetical protein V9T40_007911 [Parthenolecanium corni]|uniref:Chromo domain-containing protein n=1 Tax=Parthenolecanium corni TaxID=536013 RepID=A0AAN9TR08_9HEMI